MSDSDPVDALDLSKLSISTKSPVVPDTAAEDKVIYVGIDLGEESLSIYKQALGKHNKADMLGKYGSMVNPGHVTLGFHSDFPSESDFDSFLQTLTEHKEVKFRINGFCYDEHALAFMVETDRTRAYKIIVHETASELDASLKAEKDPQADTTTDSLDSNHHSDNEKSAPDASTEAEDCQHDFHFYPERKYLHVTCLLNGKTRAVYSNKLIRNCVYKYKRYLQRLAEEQGAGFDDSNKPRELQIDDKTFIKYFDESIECSGVITFYKFPKPSESTLIK